MPESAPPHPFVTYLETLAEDRAALAALRRGLGQPPGSVADMYPYIVPRLPENPAPYYEDTCYLVASLFAMHPGRAGSGNLGDHYARARDPNGDDSALERRFTALLVAHPDDLPFYLRQAVSFLRSKEIAIHWHQLMFDLLRWGHPNRFVQKNWANAFWARRSIEITHQNETVA